MAIYSVRLEYIKNILISNTFLNQINVAFLSRNFCLVISVLDSAYHELIGIFSKLYFTGLQKLTQEKLAYVFWML